MNFFFIYDIYFLSKKGKNEIYTKETGVGREEMNLQCAQL